MFRRASLPVLIALVVGAVGGWVVASGRLDALLKGDVAVASPPAVADGKPDACPPGGCEGTPDKAAVAAAIDQHNRRVSANLQKDGKKPNSCIIWGDDIGQSNISAYSHGVMGYKTPNIDRIAKEGMMFTDYYAEQSCTAGRASFITGQHGMRTGMTKVGLPAATLGLQKEDPTIPGC